MRLKYVHEYKDRHGKIRRYYRRGARRVPLPGEPGSAEFLHAYSVAKGEDEVRPRKKAPARSFDALAQIYYTSPDFKALRESTQRAYRSSIDGFCSKYGRRSVPGLKHAHALAILGRMEDRPGAANNLLKRLRTLYALAMRLEWVASDPTAGIRFFKGGEIHTWTEDEHSRFLKAWAPGTMPRLAWMLHMHTVLRRSDVVRLARPKGPDEYFRIVQRKGDQREANRLEIAIDPVLWAEIERHDPRLMLLVTSFGRPFTAAGYGNWFRERCREAGLPDRCSSHGLRKAAAVELAESDCTAKEIQAALGHASMKDADTYTRAANKRELIKSAQAKRRANRKLTNSKKQTG